MGNLCWNQRALILICIFHLQDLPKCLFKHLTPNECNCMLHPIGCKQDIFGIFPRNVPVTCDSHFLHHAIFSNSFNINTDNGQGQTVI